MCCWVEAMKMVEELPWILMSPFISKDCDFEFV